MAPAALAPAARVRQAEAAGGRGGEACWATRLSREMMLTDLIPMIEGDLPRASWRREPRHGRTIDGRHADPYHYHGQPR